MKFTYLKAISKVLQVTIKFKIFKRHNKKIMIKEKTRLTLEIRNASKKLGRSAPIATFKFAI